MLDSWESFTASRVTTRNYDGWLHGENAVKGWSCHAWCRATCCDATWCGPATWCGDHLCCCTSVPAAPNIPWPAAGRWCSSFLFFPSRSPASQQKPRGCKRDSVRAPVVLHPKSASRRRMPVVTATVTSPHAFVCLYALLSPFRFFFFFFSRCRESRAPTCGRVHPPMLNSCTALPPRRGSLCGRLSFYCVYGQPG